MSEDRDSDSQTEDATEKKLQEAAARGDVPYSQEAALFAALAAMLIDLIYLIPSRLSALSLDLQAFVDNPDGWRIATEGDLLSLAASVFLPLSRFLFPVLCLISVFGICAAAFQSGVHIAPDRIAPKLSRISPWSGAARIFSLRGLMEFLKQVAKFLAVAGVVAMIFNSRRSLVLSAMLIEPEHLPELALSLAAGLVAGVLVVMLVIAASDLLWARIRWLRDQRMTKQELKEELRQTEGDPLLKTRLRSLRMQRSRKRMLQAVPRATMVIANPTHYAVALRYVRSEGGAPVVVAKGKNLIALRIRAVAEENGVAVIEDRALARSLYEAAAINQPIPPQFYRAVAELVFILQEKKQSWSSGRQRTRE